MNILIVSQCSKRALTESRRIIDQFAERKGDRVWQTAITQQGLLTLRKLLKSTARKNTSVACHWLKSDGQNELIWIVGNIQNFNDRGTVPTNITSRDILRTHDENQWHSCHDMTLLASLAGLFHDIGKANILFQEKLQKKKKKQEPYRHEWISLRLFEAFVANQSDKEWLERLANVSLSDEDILFENLYKDSPTKHGERESNPFHKKTTRMAPLAQVIAWLIMTHHKLPKYEKEGNEPSCSDSKIDTWRTGRYFDGSWNSPQSISEEIWNKKDWEDVWDIQEGTIFRSATWRQKAQIIAKKALKSTRLINTNWMEDKFTLHLSRLILMLSDHFYSSQPPNFKWQDKSYKVFANTDRTTRELNQKLDEHNIGVGFNAIIIGKLLPNIRKTLPAIARHKGFKQRSIDPKFRWQDKAHDLAYSIRKTTEKRGFFGVNMASTGCGKTFGNAKIMYGLADENIGCRFNIALGLRTLTMQTGDALMNKLSLDDDDLAVLIGSQSIKTLYDLNRNVKINRPNNTEDDNPFASCGSESLEDMFSENQYVRYSGTLENSRLGQFLKSNKNLHKLISAPILVSTVDAMIPATEGCRGGKQIGPTLRLLTSDLILDEPDDFGLNDLPALTRLVNWAGLMGARVLISSATLPPAIVNALFNSYAAGRKLYQQVVGNEGAVNICCGWFDEFNVTYGSHSNAESFTENHASFVAKRVKKLNNSTSLRKMQILPINRVQNKIEAVALIAEIVHKSIMPLHETNHEQDSKTKKRVSIGLVRMANIDPLVAISEQLLAIEAPENYRYHYCIYHSRFPLLVRSYIEERLDIILKRHKKETLWENEYVQRAIKEHDEDNHIFIVIASPVCEVGRDHDYDWAIIEPSSMRSIIQIAGRVQRHRLKPAHATNVFVLSKSFKAINGVEIAYAKPGFETKSCKLVDKDLRNILCPEQFENLNSVPRIQQRPELDFKNNLIDLEHYQLENKLFNEDDWCAQHWWQHNVDWCYELQRHTKFRSSAPDDLYTLYLEDEHDSFEFKSIDKYGKLKSNNSNFEVVKEIHLSKRVSLWFDLDYVAMVTKYSARLNIDVEQTSIQFGQFRLIDIKDSFSRKWHYHQSLGFFRRL